VATEKGGNLAEKVISGLMPAAIVDQLEAVEIEVAEGVFPRAGVGGLGQHPR
jgi:hypothetical protein